jgi:hypothetical protein
LWSDNCKLMKKGEKMSQAQKDALKNKKDEASKKSTNDMLKAILGNPELVSALKESLGGKEVKHIHVSENNNAGMISSTDIPDDDLLDTPVYFHAWLYSFIDMGYTRKGQAVNPPYGKIVFKPVTPEKQRDSFGKIHILQQCTAEIWSKRQVEYLKKHPLCGSTFFESRSDLKKQDVRSTNFNLKATMEVEKLNDKQVIEVCRGRNIPVSNDFEGMRKKLATSISLEAQGKQVSFQEEIVKRSNNELLANGIK